MKSPILLYDTTLRDGTQAEEISLQLMDKVAIAHKLDELGMDYIEAGWPGSNPKDEEFFETAKGIYDSIGESLKPLGLKLDYGYIKMTRPRIAQMLK